MKVIVNRLNTVLNTPVVPYVPTPKPGVVLDLSTQPYNFDINTTQSIVLLSPSPGNVVNFVCSGIAEYDNHVWGVTNDSLYDVDVYQDGTLIGVIEMLSTKFMHFNTLTNTLYLQ